MGIDDTPRQLRHALAAAAAFAGAEAVLLLAIPAALVAAIEGVLPAGDLDLLSVLAAVVTAAALAACVLRAARRRILLRGSLWLEHALAARYGEDEPARRCVTTISRAAAGRAGAVLIEAPWLLVPLVAVVLVRPLLALVTLVGVAAVLAVAVAAAILSGPRLAEAAGIAHPRFSAPRHPPPGAHLVARYLGEGRIGNAEAVAAALASLALVATAMLALTLVVRGSMTVGAALAGLALAGWALGLAVRTVSVLPRLALAVWAWRALRDGTAVRRGSEAPFAVPPADPASGIVLPLFVPVHPPAAPATLH